MATLQQRAEQIRDEVQEAANTAQRVGQLLIDLIALIKGADSRYLSGIRPDTAHAHIHFDQGLTSRGIQVQGTANVEGALSVGDFQAGMSGAGISADGTAEVERLTVRSKLEVAEMQINRLTAMEGDWLLTESGTVEHVEQRGAQWVLTMRRRFEGDFTAFAVHDVIKGIVSTAAVRAFRPNTPLPTPETAIYAVAWLRVESVDINENSITCSLYDNADVPGGANMQPCEGMNLARWGNTSIAERRSCLYLSSREGRIVHLQGVTAPKITPENQRAAFGSLPEFLKKELAGVIDANDDYLFARGLVVQDIIRLDAKANPIPEIVDRGNWKQGAKYYGGTRNPETKRFEISDVWREGARWRCTTTKSKGTTEPPTPNSIHWTLIQARPKDGKDGGNYKTNLIDNSSFQEEIKGWDSEQIEGVFEDGLFSPVVGTRAIKFEVKSLREHDYAGISQELSSYDLPPNTICTLSVWVRATSDLRQAAIIVAPNLESRPWAGKDIVKGQKGWQRNVLKFTTPRDVGGKPIRVYMLLFNQEENATVWFAAPKLEIGDTPTEWTTSENDRKGERGADAEPTRPNLLDGTDFLQLGRKESAWKIGTHGEEPVAGRANISLFSSAVDGCVPALCAITPGTKDGEYAQLFQNVGQLIPGRTYTFSAYVRGADVAWLIVYPTPAEHFHPNTVKQDGWTRVSLTFRAPAVQDPDGVLLLLRAWHRETTPHTGYAKSVVWCAPKLEEGDRATQWCPSFRDQRGADGSPGVRGAAVRLLGDYDRLADGTPFESGHAGETYLDVVQVRQGEQVQFYQCKQPHTKSADKAPAADSEWWELGTYQGFVATDLLLARRSLIKNLQVENVVGRDERGNATFELDSATGTAYIGGTATFAGFTRRRPVVITPENWKEYGGKIEEDGDVFYLNPFAVGTYVIFRGDFGALRPTINTGGGPLNDGKESETPDNSQAMRYYGAQFMVFNDTPTSLFIGGVEILEKRTAVFTMLGRKRDNPTLWWKGELVGSW